MYQNVNAGMGEYARSKYAGNQPYFPSSTVNLSPRNTISLSGLGCGKCSSGYCKCGMGDVTSVEDWFSSLGALGWVGIGLASYFIFFRSSNAQNRRRAIRDAKSDYRTARAKARSKYPYWGGSRESV